MSEWRRIKTNLKNKNIIEQACGKCGVKFEAVNGSICLTDKELDIRIALNLDNDNCYSAGFYREQNQDIKKLNKLLSKVKKKYSEIVVNNTLTRLGMLKVSKNENKEKVQLTFRKM